MYIISSLNSHHSDWPNDRFTLHWSPWGDQYMWLKTFYEFENHSCAWPYIPISWIIVVYIIVEDRKANCEFFLITRWTNIVICSCKNDKKILVIPHQKNGRNHKSKFALCSLSTCMDMGYNWNLLGPPNVKEWSCLHLFNRVAILMWPIWIVI